MASDLLLHCLPMSHKKDARLTQRYMKVVYLMTKTIQIKPYTICSSHQLGLEVERPEEPWIKLGTPGYKAGGLSTTPHQILFIWNGLVYISKR